MKAAVVTEYGQPPRCADFDDPGEREGYQLVTMLAAGVHQIVRSLASGNHYGSGDELPIIPGVDGVARLADGSRAYVGGAPDPYGTLAEYTIVPQGFSIPVPEALDSATAAGILNPAMSSWMPMSGAGGLEPGETILVVGATGTSGRLAVQLAKARGAGRVIAAGRNAAVLEQLPELGADVVVDLSQDRDQTIAALRDAAGDGINLVLDYVWGPVAETVLESLRRSSLTRQAGLVRYCQIGALAGRNISLDAALLRSSNIQISGSGAGSIDPAALLRELPKLLELAANGVINIDVKQIPLSSISQEWDSPERLVVLPQS